MKRRTVIFGGVAAVVGVLAGCQKKDEPGVSAETIFSHTFADLSGTAQPMSQWRGKPLLVNFWATWCAPCVKEMPDLDKLAAAFPAVAFVGIGIDSPQNMADFVAKIPVGYPLLEARAAGLDLMRDLGNRHGGLPFTVIFAADGSLVKAVAGQIDVDDISTNLRLVTR